MSMRAAPTAEAPPDDVLPVVAGPPARDTGLYMFLTLLLAGGVGLFAALASNRQEAQAPAIGGAAGGEERIVSPPPLDVPEAFARYGARELPLAARAGEPRLYPAPAAPRPAFVPSAPTTSVTSRAASPAPVASAPQASYTPPPPTYYPQPSEPDRSPQPPAASQAQADGDRVLATRFANPSLTVPKGTLIPAVLETALDSTRPGAVRALVQRDVRSFDGTRVLVPRGSRLYGVYDADLQPGQSRALITWERLMRPDGVMIALASPASDPLGRAGVEGRVDSKFLARFGNAILHSALDVGVGVAASAATGGVIVAVPGQTGGGVASQGQDQRQIAPTLRVRHGTSVSVFVARDLDFSSVDS